MKIINSSEFDSYWQALPSAVSDTGVNGLVAEIIAAVRAEGDEAVRRYALRFDRAAPERFEIALGAAKSAWEELVRDDAELASALELASDHIRRFSEQQKAQLTNFEYTMEPGLITGQRVIPVRRAAVYAPAGRFPLISTVLMGVIPAITAGVEEVFAVSPPLSDGLPDRRVLAAAHLAGAHRIFALGGAQAVAALALGTRSVPRVDVIAGPGNKYVAAAKRALFGEVGIDFVAGPTDVLIITDTQSPDGDAAAADLIAADMLAQAEHDADARARALVPSRDFAALVTRALERRLALLSAADTALSAARASLDAGGLIIVYERKEEAVHIANTIAPEHLEIQVSDPGAWIPALKNYGSLFIGTLAAEVLGDYSAGINHTLPTSSSARFTGGLSARHFLKTLTTLRCEPGPGFEAARRAAEIIARAEGLAGHRESAASRKT